VEVAQARRARVSVVGFGSRRMNPSARYYYGLGRVGSILPKPDQENRPSVATLLWARSGRIGSAASQIGLDTTTSDVTHAIGGSVERCSALPCHSMLWRVVTLQLVLYFGIVFDVIARTLFRGHSFGDELREIREVHGRDCEGLSACVLVARALSARGGAWCVYACWEWGCSRVLRAWGRLGLTRLPPSGSCHLFRRT